MSDYEMRPLEIVRCQNIFLVKINQFYLTEIPERGPGQDLGSTVLLSVQAVQKDKKLLQLAQGSNGEIAGFA